MPIYEYKCDRCDEVIEKIQKFIDPPLTVHEVCGGSLARLISTSALQFKGSGFYITDYKKSGAKDSKSPNSKTGETTTSTKAETTSSTTESAPAAAPATTATPAAASTSTESKK